MNTQNNEPKHERKIPSQMEYRERAHWKVGEDIITIVGGEEKQPIAFIKLEKYDENKKPVFSCRDVEGNVLAENTTNLYELKRDLKDKEIALTKAMREKDKPQVKQGIETPAPQTETVTKAPAQDKGTELKKVRGSKTAKSKENEQTISR